MTLAEPTFPPLLNGRVVIRGDDPRGLAIAGAQTGELGAGDTLWLQDTTQAELAIVLEPEGSLAQSAQMLPLAVAAAGDSLATLTPPQVGVQCRWPATPLLNGADVGKCSLTVPASCQPNDVPAWMVLHCTLRLTFDDAVEPGTTPGITSLVEEGGEELTTVDVLDSFSRHFLSLLDTWTNDGFADVVQNWSSRADGLEHPVELPHPTGAVTARVQGLDEDGNLLVKLAGSEQTTALALLDCLSRAAPMVASSP